MSSEMLQRLPKFMRASGVYISLFEATDEKIHERELAVLDLQRQLFVETATWGLDIFEQNIGIPTDLSKSYEDRRAVIKSRDRGTGIVDAALIKIVADSYTNGDVEVTFESGSIRVAFISVVGIPPNMPDVMAAIEDIKPAHLPVTFVFNYMTWDELDAQSFTWDELDALNLTWDEFEKYV